MNLNIFEIYKEGSLWLFDDPDKELIREPFVTETSIVIDTMLQKHLDFYKIKGPLPTEAILFITSEFFGPHVFRRLYDGKDPATEGTTYQMDNENTAIWLCPALLKYYPAAPAQLFMSVRTR